MLITQTIIMIPFDMLFLMRYYATNTSIAYYIFMTALYIIIEYWALAIPGDVLSKKRSLLETFHNPVFWGIFLAITGSAAEKIVLLIANPGPLLLLFTVLSTIIVGFAYYQCYKQQISSTFRIKMISTFLITQLAVIFMSDQARGKDIGNVIGVIIILLLVSVIEYFALAIPGYFLNKRDKTN
jgi:hypothetical protein